MDINAPRHQRLPILMAVLCLAGFTLTGCAQASDDTRAAWLQNTLLADNQRLMEREPELSAGKFKKMASTPYNYFRGTLGQFLRDGAQPGSGAGPVTTFGDAASSRVRLIGDPHMENIGTFISADGEQVLDFNDFDASTYGLWIWDIRRLALSAWITGRAARLDNNDDTLPEDMARLVAEGYAGELQAMAQTGATLRIRSAPEFGAVVADLMRRAQRDGARLEALADYTRLDRDGTREMFFGVVDERIDPEIIEDETLALSDEELHIVEQALAAYPETLSALPASATFFDLKGASKRLGAGVSSYPMLRYYVLIEGPTASSQDDVLLEFKEIGDPNMVPGLRLYPEQPFYNNAERVVDAQRALQESEDNDPLLGWACVGPLPFRVRHRTKYQKALSVARMTEKVAAGEFTEDDLRLIARLAGRLLARSHALADTLEGRPGLEVIAPLISGRTTQLVAEIEAFVIAYGPRTLDDHALLIELIEQEGPSLGYMRAAH